MAYCLRITDVDPLDFDLIFERFLNPERVSLPDIDIDFCERRRGEVIDYVTRKYGRENVAQIITFGTMKAKAVVRDVGRVLEMPFADVDKVAKQIPPTLDMTLDKALEESQALKDLEQSDPKVKELLSVARRLEGMTRHASVHAAGVVIAPKAITEYAPLYKGARDEITTQWSMKEIERIGLLKMDFLGLSTLTLIYDAIAEIERTTGEQLDIDRIPLDDAKTYQIFQDGQTYGIFQFESSGMRDILRKAKPQRLEDLIALNALYRPGPLRSGMVDDFIARKGGKVEIKYELPQLEPILRETYGVIAYQEQVMRIASELAGFTLGEADILRKAMGKKNADVMQAQRAKFVDGAKKRGVEREEGGARLRPDGALRRLRLQQVALDGLRAARVSDGVSQGELPVALRGGAADDRGAEHRQARAVSRRVPRARHSGAAARHQREPARLHRDAGGRPLRPDGDQERRRRRDSSRCSTSGRSRGASRRCTRSARILDLRLVNKRVFESLVKAGAFDSLAGAIRPASRARRCAPRLFAAIDAACEHGARHQRDKNEGQAQLFGGFAPAGDDGGADDAAPLPDATPWTETEQLAFEKETLGLVLERPSGRSLRAASSRSSAPARRAELADAPVERIARRRVGTRRAQADRARHQHRRHRRRHAGRSRRAKGDRMAVFTLEDAQGGVEVIVFPETYQRSASLIETGTMVLVRGKLERDEESVRILASEILPIDSVRERLAREVAIRVKMPADRGLFEALGEIFSRHRGDRRVSFEIGAVGAGAAARQGGCDGADPRAAVAGADRGSRAGRRRRDRCFCGDDGF